MNRRLAIALAVALVPSCRRPELRPAANASARGEVFLSAALQGSLEPCGCSEEMRGGIDRAAHLVAAARASDGPVLYIDAGDSLFARAKLEPAEVPQAERKARAIADELRAMGLALHAVGELDDARGEAFRQSLGLADLTGDGYRLLDLGGHAVGVAVAHDAGGLVRVSREARAAGAEWVVGVLDLPMDAALKAAEAAGLEADLVVSSHPAGGPGSEADLLVRARVPVVRLEGRGRSVLRLELAFAGPARERFLLVKGRADVERELDGLGERVELLRRQLDDPGLRPDAKQARREKLEELVRRREALAATPAEVPEGRNWFRAQAVPLDPGMGSDPAAKQLLAIYSREVGALDLAWARQNGEDCRAAAAGEAAFVGSEACRACHAAAFPAWEASKHARAYETLDTAGKGFDLDCVRCHVTGFGRPGGVCRLDRLEGRRGVGCETCHGAGSVHVSDPGRARLLLPHEEATCTGCHDPENSRHFEIGRFTNEILGPGHGLPDAGS